MKRKLTLMLALLFVWTGVAWSQGVTVKGVVTSEEDGLPIVGAAYSGGYPFSISGDIRSVPS